MPRANIIGDVASWRGQASEYSGLPTTLEGEARRPATPWSREAASGQPDRIPSIEASPALYRQLASQAPSRRRSARIAQMNWTDPCYNLTPRRSERPFYFWLNGKEFLSRNRDGGAMDEGHCAWPFFAPTSCHAASVRHPSGRALSLGSSDVRWQRAGFGIDIPRLRSRVRRRTQFINLRFKISRFLNQHGSKRRVGGFLGKLEKRRHLTHKIIPA
jgi:hypothetical protein